MTSAPSGLFGRVGEHDRRGSAATVDWPVAWDGPPGWDTTTWSSSNGELRVRLAGSPASTGTDPAALPEAVARAMLGEDDPAPLLRSIANHWVAVAEHRGRRLVRIASDSLGLYPLFVGEGTSPVLGSDVWAMVDRGLLRPRALNYRSLANWLLFTADFSGGALFSGLSRLPPGAIVTIGPDGRDAEDYCHFTFGDEPAEPGSAATAIVGMVEANLRASIRAYPGPLAAGLSGGNDSRLLVALLRELDHSDLVVWTAEWDRAEAEAAELAARALEVERLRIEIDGSLFDFYEYRSGYQAAGYPQNTFVVHEVVRRFTGSRSQVHGYIGGLVMGGRFDLPAKLDDELFETLRDRDAIEGAYIFHPSIRDALLAAGSDTFRRFFAHAAPAARHALAANLYHRQRYYIPPTFLSFRDTARTFLPFYSHAILDFVARHRIAVGEDGLYPALFERRYPRLAGIPTDRVLRSQPLHETWAKSRFWARQGRRLAVRHLLRGHPAVARGRSVPRLAARGLGYPAAENWVRLLHRVDRLEARLRRAGLEIDWVELERQVRDGSPRGADGSAADQRGSRASHVR